MYRPLAQGLEKMKQRARVRAEVEEYQHLIGMIDQELDDVRRRLMPVYPEPVRDYSELTQGNRLEAPPSEAEMHRMRKAIAGLEMSLGGAMWGIGAYGIAAGSVMAVGTGAATTAAVAPSVPVAESSMAVAAEAAVAARETTMTVGSNVVQFGNMSRQTVEQLVKFTALVAANEAIINKAAAQEPESSETQIALTRDFLSNPAKTEQRYIYWPD